jgi:predicted 3-demethylubiquinone-9 3-methyltransferase (glyoxalase superfamily)
MLEIKNRITPFFSYVDSAQEAANFYVSILPDSKILRTIANPGNGAVMTVEFELANMKFVALNTGQDWKFSPALSLSVACGTQAEIDALWSGLTADGGVEVACGWLTDKFGMSWQIVPSQLNAWLDSGKPENIQRMFEALWQMKKLDIGELQSAFDGRS